MDRSTKDGKSMHKEVISILWPCRGKVYTCLEVNCLALIIEHKEFATSWCLMGFFPSLSDLFRNSWTAYWISTRSSWITKMQSWLNNNKTISIEIGSLLCVQMAVIGRKATFTGRRTLCRVSLQQFMKGKPVWYHFKVF